MHAHMSIVQLATYLDHFASVACTCYKELSSRWKMREVRSSDCISQKVASTTIELNQSKTKDKYSVSSLMYSQHPFARSCPKSQDFSQNQLGV